MGVINKLSQLPLFWPISKFIIIWQLLVLIYLVADFTVTVMAFCFPD